MTPRSERTPPGYWADKDALEREDAERKERERFPNPEFWTVHAHRILWQPLKRENATSEINVLKCEAEEGFGVSAHQGQDRYWLSSGNPNDTHDLDYFMKDAQRKSAVLVRNSATTICDPCRRMFDKFTDADWDGVIERKEARLRDSEK